VEDKYRHLHGTVGEEMDISDTGNDAYAGGINIAEARQRLQQEDRVDRQLYRDRIQQKHRVCLCFVFISFAVALTMVN